LSKPIFYDATGRRARWVRAAVVALVVAVVAVAALLAITVSTATVRAPLALREDAARPRGIADRVPAGDQGAWLPRGDAAATTTRLPVLGFYMPWDAPSRRSLAEHVGQVDWLVPGLASVSGADHRFRYEHDAFLRGVVARARRRPAVWPMVQNAREDGEWDGTGTARLLADRAAAARFADRLAAMVAAERGAGVMLDLESLPASAHGDYRRFLRDLRARFAPRGWQVALAVPVADPAWDLAAYAAVADRLVLMAYDEHWMGGAPGPIASQPWFARVVADAVAAAGRDKAIVALGNYAYDWADGATVPMGVEQAWALARRAGTRPAFDPASGNWHFAYRRGGRDHRVWMLDAVTTHNQRRAVMRTGAAAVALWRMGTEDPRWWDAVAGAAPAALSALPMPGGVAIEGAGEILRLDAAASGGARALHTAGDGLIHAAAMQRLPGADTVQRTGGRRRMVALTFDDGPDPAWTPRILDVLKREGAPATFFVTGANALGQGALLRRILAEGSELGNHSTSHADLSHRSPDAVRLELNATERLVEAYTGHAMRLFRPPFLGDADPDRRDELHATRVAASLGYVTVGLNVDPLDWQSPSPRQIVARTIAQVEAGTAERPAQIVLLHDSGGDRSRTLAALPGIVRGLRARGYDLVGVSRLAGLPRAAVMPRLDGAAAGRAAGTRGLFEGLAWLRDALAALFLAVIAIGMARSAALAVLALRHRRVAPPAAAPHLVPRFVSVLIPAFNEARVIEASVRRILASRDARIEVIVIDDGSTDGTSDVVRAAFAIDPRVRLLTLANGGKARALNAALRIARGDVVVALDADTQFEADTIAKLLRWFADPAIGAVAGNAKIGNAVNIVTRWQAVEYVTAQNLERRALDALGAVTVVPGAVGAWRRTALDAVGGYPVDTLAEDQDLTIAIQRAGWRVACDVDAVAWTEAPETARALFRQRYRWAYGTLQCLWKHRALLARARPRGLAWIGLPQAILFQLLFTLAAPLIDVALVGSVAGTAWRVADRGWALAGTDALWIAGFWFAFAAVDLASGWLAYRLDAREGRLPVWRMLSQRFGYRQLLYVVVLRALFAALCGPKVGWGKLERSGSVVAPMPLAATPPALAKAA
jgi:peptidoglycan/xylan/chitin deacetylase (PgdA/CDA1 family)/GT2 family glycosyltransferase